MMKIYVKQPPNYLITILNLLVNEDVFPIFV